MQVEIVFPKVYVKTQFWKTQAKFILDDSRWGKNISVQEAIFLLLY